MANILVVDDMDNQREQLSELLESAGHHVVGQAADGEEALARYDELKPDLVTMDISMPGMDGITAARKLSARDKNARIIMITCHGESEIMYDAVAVPGVVEFLTKPLAREVLSSVLARVAG